MKTALAVLVIGMILLPALARAEGPSISPYGYVKFDAVYDQGRVNSGDYARWVESEVAGGDDSQFNTTANQSRFGIDFQGADLGRVTSGGKVEMDFYGGGAENTAQPMMRQAYVTLEWPASHFTILAGQAADVISPLVPATLNYTVGWWAGDIGYRHPQLRLSKAFGDKTRLLLEGAASRNIGDALVTSPGDTGEDSGRPTVQGRVALTVPAGGGKWATLGLSGHRSREEYDYVAIGRSEEVDSWSANVDLTIPFSTSWTFTGEYWRGANLDDYLGGVGQGVVIETTLGTYVNGSSMAGTYLRSWPVQAQGGWAALSFGPYNAWRFNLGGSLDDPKDSDLVAGARTKNTSYFWNTTLDATKTVQIGLEISYWKTEYLNQSKGDSYRIQQSFLYKF